MEVDHSDNIGKLSILLKIARTDGDGSYQGIIIEI